MKWVRTISLLAACVCLAMAQPQSRDLTFEKAGRSLDGKGKSWAVVIGVSRYQNVPPRAQLRFADRDAKEFAAFLQSPAGGGFPAAHIKLLTDEQATLPAIRTALNTWVARHAEADDIVYIFYAGHGVIENGQDGYLMAHDSDPQNLYATALAVPELDRIVNDKIRARMIVLIADACHAGSIGWASSSRAELHPLLISGQLEGVGKSDRSVLRLLASRASERSYEDERWGGGHGVFTFSLLEGLKGRAERERDGVLRVSEVIDYVSASVPDQTQAQQHPRVAGNFEARLPLALLPAAIPHNVTLEVRAPAGTAVLLDNTARGSVGATGTLLIPSLTAGTHDLRLRTARGESITQQVQLTSARVVVDATPASPLAAQVRQLIEERKVLEAGGAWDVWQKYKQEAPKDSQQAAVEALLTQALEEIGQQSVNDYVASSTAGLKRDMLRRSAEAYRRLRTLRPNEPSLEGKQLFCEGRALILEGKPADAIPVLQQSIAVDPKSACPYNALGVAYERTGNPAKALESYLQAAKLTPEWYLPQWQMAMQQQAKGDLAAAIVTMRKAVDFSPQVAALARFSLTRLYRLQNRLPEAIAEAKELINRQPGYAPIYAELGTTYEAANQRAAAADAYEAYLQLAPNFSDSVDVRGRMTKLRAPATATPASHPVPTPASEAPRAAPTLQRKKK